jgi:hypothetical protein
MSLGAQSFAGDLGDTTRIGIAESRAAAAAAGLQRAVDLALKV